MNWYQKFVRWAGFRNPNRQDALLISRFLMEELKKILEQSGGRILTNQSRYFDKISDFIDVKGKDSQFKRDYTRNCHLSLGIAVISQQDLNTKPLFYGKFAVGGNMIPSSKDNNHFVNIIISINNQFSLQDFR